MPSNYLETALWLEADRMGFLLDAVTKTSFENQRKTVTNEKEQNQLNQPYGTVWEVKNQNMYPSDHPYSWPVIGYSDDLERSTEEDLKNFYLRWYGPNNSTLTVAGDIDKAKTLEWIEKYFGGINQCPTVKNRMVPRVILPEDKYATIEDEIFLPLTVMSFPTVPSFHKDEAAMDILSSIMGRGNNSIFYQNFVKTEKAIDAASFNVKQELSGEFVIQVVSFPQETLEETEKLIRSTISDFETNVLNGSELTEKVKTAKAVEISQTYDVLGSIQRKAETLSRWEWMLGRTYNLQDRLDAINGVTNEDVIRVYNKYIKNKKAMIVTVVPRTPVPGEKDFVKQSFNPNANIKAELDEQYAGLTYVKAVDDFDRSVRPEHGSPKTAIIPESYRSDLPNGIKVIGTHTNEVPKIAVLLSIQGGSLFDDGDDFQKGVASLTAEMMNESTKNFSSEEISKELDKLGSSISFWSDDEGSYAFVYGMAKNIDKSLALFKEKLFNPAFKEEDFKRIKKQTLEGIQSERKVSAAIAEKAFRKILYGNNAIGESATYSTVDKVKLADIQAYYDKYYAPDLASVVIVGDISQDMALAKIDFLSTWEKKNVTLPVIEKFPSYEGPQIMLIDKLGAAQSVLAVGFLANKYDYNGPYFKSRMMNFPLGGNFSSRINLNLREDKGYTYGIRSVIQGTEYPGPFFVWASVKTNATDSALVEVLNEIKNYRDNGITDEELSFTKSSLLLSDILNYETTQQKANFLERIVRYNLPSNYIDEQEAIIKATTKEDVDALAKDYLKMEKMVILVVGNAYVIKKPLEKMGYGKVKQLDADNIKLSEFK